MSSQDRQETLVTDPSKRYHVRMIINKGAASEAGFTLIELMVVVLTVGILLTIAAPVFLRSTELARTHSCQTNLRTLDGTIQTYAAEQGVDPADIERTGPGAIKTDPVMSRGCRPFLLINRRLR